MEEGFLWSPTLPQLFHECLVKVHREDLLSARSSLLFAAPGGTVALAFVILQTF